jgi:hypothetical protein
VLLPKRDKAYVPPEKLTGYLLSETHTIGKAKARVFSAAGFHLDNSHLLEQALLKIARVEEVQEQVESPYGAKYVIDGTIQSPAGTDIRLRTIWIIEAGDDRPRLVTAYPR